MDDLKIEIGKKVTVKMDDKGRVIPLNGRDRRFLGISIKNSREYSLYKKLKKKVQVEHWAVLEVKEIIVKPK